MQLAPVSVVVTNAMKYPLLFLLTGVLAAASCAPAAPALLQPVPSANVPATETAPAMLADAGSSALVTDASLGAPELSPLCTMTNDDLRYEAPVVLRTPNGHVFAKLKYAKHASLVLGENPKFDIEAQGVLFTTVPQGSDVPVYVVSPRKVGELVTAGGGTALQWRVQGQTIHVRPADDPRVRPLVAAIDSAAVKCEDLRIDPQAIRAPGCENSTGLQLTADAPLDLASTPAGPIVAQLILPAQTAVRLCARTSTDTQIGWHAYNGKLASAFVTGWVVTAALAARALPPSHGRLSGSHSTYSITSHWTGCTMQHPLWVNTGAGREPIGTVLAGTRLQRLREVSNMTAVTVVGPRARHGNEIQLREDAYFLVSAEAVKDCQ
jgi:hypothetical protein